MALRVIYEPRGKALEYGPLACTIYRGCVHGCKYCYVPAVLRTTHADFNSGSKPRDEILAKIAHDAHELSGDPRRVFFSFMSDPYQPDEQKFRLTRQALAILSQHNVKAKVLTKGGTRACDDFDQMARDGVEFGTTLTSLDDGPRQLWEPGAAPVADRLDAMRRAFAAGIHVWVSLEPVFDPEQTLAVIREIRGFVNHVKLGKINHVPSVDKTVDWRKFLHDARAELSGVDHYIKLDLLKFDDEPRRNVPVEVVRPVVRRRPMDALWGAPR